MRKILAVLAATSTINIHAADWFQGIVSSVQTGVTIFIHFQTYLNDYEDSKIDVNVKSYTFTTNVRYPIGNQTYQTQWRVFIDQNGVYQYRTQQTINAVPGQLITTPFEIGTDGLPLTKRQWACSEHTATTWFEASSSSMLTLKAKHNILKYAQYASHAPTSYKAEVMTIGRMWEATCSANPVIAYVPWSVTKTFQRHQEIAVDYTGTNIEVEDMWGRYLP
jgi:hypothetical protein